MAADTGLLNIFARRGTGFVDPSKSFGKNFEESFNKVSEDVRVKSESLKLEQQKLNEIEAKRQKEREELYKNAPLIDTSGLPQKFKPAFTKAAMGIKNERVDLVNNKSNMDPLEFIDKQNEHKSKVEGLTKQAQTLGQWQLDYMESMGDSGSDFLSQSMTSEEQELLGKIFNGELPMEIRDGEMGFINGKEFLSLNNLPKPKEKAAQEHLQLQDFASSIGEKIGAKGEGIESEYYNYEVNKIKDKIASLGDEQVDSLFADYSGLAGEKGVAAIYLKELSKPEKVEEIFNYYKKSADAGAMATKSYYDKVQGVKAADQAKKDADKNKPTTSDKALDIIKDKVSKGAKGLEELTNEWKEDLSTAIEIDGQNLVVAKRTGEIMEKINLKDDALVRNFLSQLVEKKYGNNATAQALKTEISNLDLSTLKTESFKNTAEQNYEILKKLNNFK